MKRIALVAACLVASTACDDEERKVSLLDPIPPGTVQAVVERVAEYGRDSVLLRLHVASKDVQFGAYEGALRFDAAALEVLDVRAAVADGEHRVINSERAAEGIIRFAVFGTEALVETRVFDVLARPKLGLDAANLVATLTVVGEVSGTALQTERIRVNDGVRDARTGGIILR
jgi:hypothetical protein